MCRLSGWLKRICCRILMPGLNRSSATLSSGAAPSLVLMNVEPWPEAELRAKPPFPNSQAVFSYMCEFLTKAAE